MDAQLGLVSFDCRDATRRLELRHAGSADVETFEESLARNKALFGSQIDYFWPDKASLHQVIYISVRGGDQRRGHCPSPWPSTSWSPVKGAP